MIRTCVDFPPGCKLQRQSLFLLNADIAVIKWESDSKGGCCLGSLWGLHMVLWGVCTQHAWIGGIKPLSPSQTYTYLPLGTSRA